MDGRRIFCARSGNKSYFSQTLFTVSIYPHYIFIIAPPHSIFTPPPPLPPPSGSMFYETSLAQ
jgi:hypothetical protein